MRPQIFLGIVFFIFTVVQSLTTYNSLVNRRKAYLRLADFAKMADNNLNSNFYDIGKILSDSFGFSVDDNITKNSFISIGISDNDAKKIIEYTLNYRYMNIFELRDATTNFQTFALKASQAADEQYRKNTYSLLCLPIFSLIFLILAI